MIVFNMINEKFTDVKVEAIEHQMEMDLSNFQEIKKQVQNAQLMEHISKRAAEDNERPRSMMRSFFEGNSNSNHSISGI